MKKTETAGKSSAISTVTTCPVERAIQVIGGKWKLLVLRSLLLNGAQGYNQLLASVKRISAKELTRNLRELTTSGLVVHCAEEPARKLCYALTPQGHGLMPAFEALLTWGKGQPSTEGTNIPVR